MAKAPASPLPPDLMKRVNEALGALGEANQICAKCKNCGYDTAAWDAYILHLQNRLNAVNHEFGGRKLL